MNVVNDEGLVFPLDKW